MGVYYVRTDLGNTIEAGTQSQPFKSIDSLQTALNSNSTTATNIAGHTIRIWASDTLDMRVNLSTRALSGLNWTIERWFDSSNFSQRPLITRAKRVWSWTYDATNELWVSDPLANIQYGGCITEDGIPLNWAVWAGNRANTTILMANGSASFDLQTLQYVIKTRGGPPSNHTYLASCGAYNLNVATAGGFTIREMDFRYSAYGVAIGISGLVRGGWVIEDTDVSLTGAGTPSAGGTAQGNGIGIVQNDGSLGHSYIRRCTVKDIFDSGISPQLFDQNTVCRDITLEDITIARCGMHGYELSLTSTDPLAVNNSVIDNVNIVRAISHGHGKGWAGNRYGSSGNAFAFLTNNRDPGVKIINSGVKYSQGFDCTGRGAFMYHTNGEIEARYNQFSGCDVGITATARLNFAAGVNHQATDNEITACNFGIELGRYTSGNNTATLNALRNKITRCTVGIANITKPGDTAIANDNTIENCNFGIRDVGEGTFTKARNDLYGNNQNYQGTSIVQGTDTIRTSADTRYLKRKVEKRINIQR